MEKMNTMKFEPMKDKSRQVKEILTQVHGALSEKGYDPVSQFVGYFMSGDPTYITSHSIPENLVVMTGITDEMLRGAPQLKEALEEAARLKLESSELKREIFKLQNKR